MRKFLFFFSFSSIFILTVQAQSFQIMRYGFKDGLPHESTYTTIQDPNGYVWVSTTLGISRLDGISFTKSFLGDTLPNSIASTAFLDREGRLWFGHVDGMISVFRNNKFKVFRQNEAAKSSIVGFAEDELGNVMAMTQQNGMVIIDAEMKVVNMAEPFEDMFISQFHRTVDGDLLIGSFDGLTMFKAKEGSLGFTKVGQIPDIPPTQIKDIIEGINPNSYWVGTDEEGLFFIEGSGSDPSAYSVVKAGLDQGLEYAIVNSLMLDENGYLWVSDYGVGVYRFKLQDANQLTNRFLFNVSGGLPEEYIEDIFKDDEGNVWFASNSNGLSILRDQAFTFFDLVDDYTVPEISAINIRESDYWLGSKDGELYNAGMLGVESVQEYSSGLPKESITALWQDDKGGIFIGTEFSGVYYKEKASSNAIRYFRADNSLGNSVNALAGDVNFLWIATNDGIYRIDRRDNSTEHQTTNTGLPHNVVNDVLIDKSGKVWIATRGNGIYCVSEQGSNITIKGNPKLELISLAEDKRGRIWASTSEDGVIRFARDSIQVYNAENGLMSKYTYAIAIDPKGFVWVGHRLGLSKIDPSSGNIVVYDQEMGFTSDILHRSIASSDLGLMLFGTNKGVIMYDAFQSKQDTLAPRLNISQLSISDSIYDSSKDIQLPFKAYKIRIEFVGINLSNPEQVTYRYKLDGYSDWSEPTREIYANYDRIEDGDYTFMLSACDGNGNCTGEVEMVHINVKIPIWKAWWFILSLFFIAVSSVFIIIKVRERNQKALQERLEYELDERTREVIHQKEEIEIKNRDITDSINYAQRIQASILPPIQRLHNTFSGSFVYYQPRDIVSGDFYWYDKLDEDRFLVVCADSTGHGVPGAFMSMIGTTLLKDICSRKDVNTPSDVLSTLDKEVRTALNQNQEADGSNDGMDIIVAEINLRTNKLIISSAMRPVILYKDGEQIYVKGSRSAVGGQLDEDRQEKEFANEEFQLKKGDILYMFSDGYPDQFGGPLGRKFKMVRLKNLLRDINDKPMEEQYNYIKSNFLLWKEDLEQVDDVLFMGIKI